MLFSIIVPVYNVEIYIDECIRSCIVQTFTDFELILIPNGSTDNSKSICNRWKDKDPRIRVIDLEVAGVSNARNVGIENAKGRWIVFADADDYMMPKALEILAQHLNDNTDMIACNYVQNLNTRFTQNTQRISADLYIKAMLDPPDYFQNIKALTWNAGLLGVNWAKAFRRSLISENKIRFDTGITVFEDLLFNLDFLTKAKYVKCVDTAIYYYRINESSISRTCSVKRINQRLDYIDNLKRRINIERDESIRKALLFQASQNLLRTFVVASNNRDEQETAKKIIIEYMEQCDSRTLLIKTRGTKLSLGKIQAKFYVFLLFLLRIKAYNTAYTITVLYANTKRKG